MIGSHRDFSRRWPRLSWGCWSRPQSLRFYAQESGFEQLSANIVVLNRLLDIADRGRTRPGKRCAGR